jgi:hypothetical protein
VLLVNLALDFITSSIAYLHRVLSVQEVDFTHCTAWKIFPHHNDEMLYQRIAFNIDMTSYVLEEVINRFENKITVHRTSTSEKIKN